MCNEIEQKNLFFVIKLDLFFKYWNLKNILI